MPFEAPLRIAVVDDHKIVRTGLRAAIAREPDMIVVGEAASGAQALELLMVTQPDVVLLDHHLPGELGLDLVERMRVASPRSKIVVLTFDDGRDMILAALDKGSAGFVSKGSPMAELLCAVRRVADGRCYISVPEVSAGRSTGRNAASKRGAAP
jgi:DNA-binding NarL/FixJ family response regulator